MTGKDYARLLGFICWLSIVIFVWLRMFDIVDSYDTYGLLGFVVIGFFSAVVSSTKQ